MKSAISGTRLYLAPLRRLYSQSSGKCSDESRLPTCHSLTKEHVRRIVLSPNVLKQQSPDFIPLQKAKRKNYALLMSYCGRNYNGMQTIRTLGGVNNLTIENNLFSALTKAGLIDHKGLNTPQMYSYNRVSRTDKKVSAARQVVALTLPSHFTNCKLVNLINKHLPEDIRIFTASQVTKDFNPRKECNLRGYSYLCPSYAFAPIDQITNINYRITEDEVKYINNLMSNFLGRKNFCNFTSGKYYRDSSCMRTVTSFNINQLFDKNNVEWIRIQIEGESFILHQIRKMVGLVIAVVRGHMRENMIPLAFEEGRINVPKAPALGLVLENQCFDYYNASRSRITDNKTLNFGDAKEEIEAFREKYIDTAITEEEIKTNSMITWLQILPMYHYIHVPEERSNECYSRSVFGIVNKDLKAELTTAD